MKSCSFASAFMRMRSPSSAPPERLRVGSIATTATRRSGKKRTMRFRISSVSEDLPAPPVPVMPTTGGRFSVLRRERAQPRDGRLVALLEQR